MLCIGLQVQNRSICQSSEFNVEIEIRDIQNSHQYHKISSLKISGGIKTLSLVIVGNLTETVKNRLLKNAFFKFCGTLENLSRCSDVPRLTV